jgi:hypothetical protein
MKKRSLQDSIRQSVSERRAFALAARPRPFNPKKVVTKKVLARTLVIAPKAISVFGKDYEAFSQFLKNITIQSKKGRLLIDLSNVTSTKAAALLVLYATIEQLQKERSDRHIIKTTCCKVADVSVAFRTFGLWALTGESRIRPKRTYADSLEICTMPHAAHGGDDKRALRKVLKYAQKSVLRTGMHEGAMLAYNAITESISNVWQHAYDDVFFKVPVPESLRNWWIIVQCIDDQFFIAVYDMGAGIPKTISTKPWAADLIATISEWFDLKGFKVLASPDAKSIKAAVDYGKSRFKLDNRGKGLTEAKDFVQRNPMGSMIIFSGLGYYEYQTKDDKESLETLSTQFKGTLIQWNLKLEMKEDE